MDKAFAEFVIAELRDHIERLKDCAYEEDPDGETVEYHHGKAETLIGMLEKQMELEKVGSPG